MARTTAQAFDHFYDNYVVPTTSQRADVSSKKSTTEKYLSAAFPGTSTLPLKRVVLIGSAKRGTHVQPVDDIDVLAEFTNKDDVFEQYRYSSGAFLQRIRKALDAKTNIKKIGARGQAVRLFYVNGAHVDIAPVFKWSGSGFALPSGTGDWITTDPECHATWFAGQKRSIGSNLEKVARYAKVWNQLHSSYLESFHLEVIVADIFASVGGDTREALKIFFNSAINHLDVTDPAGHSGLLSSYLTPAARSQLRSRLNTAYNRAVSAIEAANQGDHEEAKRLWRIELGNQFPLA